MNILYGVQGTGNGHISRARAMAEAFARLPHVEVKFLFSGRPASEYFDMGVFGDYEVRRGLTFVSEAGKVSMLKTALNNSLVSFVREVRELDVSGYDLVVSDFEPLTAHAARRHGVPTVSVSHQSAFAYDVPKHSQSLLDKVIMRHFAPTETKIGLHWYHFNQPILPPIIDLQTVETSKSGTILTYLPFEKLEEVIGVLQHFTQRFICFHPSCQEARVEENVDVRPLSKAAFHKVLASCDGVIANGGFELPSEALSLGKKLLLKPLSGQFEQQSNVSTLDTLGLATSMESLDLDTIREWLKQTESSRVKYPNVASELAAWLGEGDLSTLPLLRESLWSQVSFPEHVTDLLSDFWPQKTRKRAMFSMRLPSQTNKSLRQH
ncbi:MJ1255/VC2487 family glycosyltransferase [Grimontia sp. NTOU-MAR1]|uniref:MJ1255/VC2487 family glycosyltransferase n=1 Tax=Grimontia sp. NTOU-MAR1 TaxID=3111011 RepID=UPI002DC03C19|nr:MJ1255/VC2487 family glycosyltransferase [Grimontia sp. NTOU-MAR1]WRV96296.1 MJ1255/VC2487 family glycosyltransferase [Grimontia sp. NTOU-MAR1]